MYFFTWYLILKLFMSNKMRIRLFDFSSSDIQPINYQLQKCILHYFRFRNIPIYRLNAFRNFNLVNLYLNYIQTFHIYFLIFIIKNNFLLVQQKYIFFQQLYSLIILHHTSKQGTKLTFHHNWQGLVN